MASSGVALQSLQAVGLVEESADEDSLEVWPSFEENAFAKARYFFERTGGTYWVLAEDSGLCVNALDGAPGVRSKRWGEDARCEGESVDAANNRLLLERLSGVESRAACFRCAAVLVWPGGQLSASGETQGRILEQDEGSGGFGYDPLFWSEDLGAAFGAVTRAEKSRVSHRARAVSALWLALRDCLASGAR